MSNKYRHTILLVDDEVSITKSLQRLFRKEDYTILTASSGQEGLETLKKSEKLVSLIISDQRMPEMTGAEFLERAKKIFPSAMRFLLTGYSDMEAITEAVNRGEIHRYITKPWNDEDLLIQVRNAIQQYELLIENKRLLALTKKQNRELNELNKNLEKKIEERSGEIIKKNKELEANLYNTVRAFASLAEMHAPTLAGHGRRVALMSREVAQLLALSEEEITQIEIAALLHDIGKLGFPEKFMSYRENSWSPEDMELFRKHPEEGQAIVRFINRLDHVGLLIRSHHERYDGHGYPDKLSEEMIPIGSMIIAVTDAYDKIVHLKAQQNTFIDEYMEEREITQNHLPEDEILQQAAIYHIKKGAFNNYNPDIVKIFLDYLKTSGIRVKNEREVPIESLSKGMVLARSLYTGRGRFLLSYNTVLTKDHVEKLKIIHKRDPINEIICVTDL